MRSRRKFLESIALSFGALAGAACGGGTSKPLERPATSIDGEVSSQMQPPITYVALGASDAAGVGVEDPARDSWVAVLSRVLPQPTRLVNLGIPGVRLHEAVEVELPPALEAQPSLVTIWLVVNDILSGVPLERYSQTLRQLLGELRSKTPAKIAIGNVPDSSEESGFLGLNAVERRGLTAQWNAAIQAIADEYDVVLVDLYHRWPVVQHPEYIGPDRLHPTVEGYRALAATFHTVLRERGIV